MATQGSIIQCRAALVKEANIPLLQISTLYIWEDGERVGHRRKLEKPIHTCNYKSGGQFKTGLENILVSSYNISNLL